jgi:hypothetical protein
VLDQARKRLIQYQRSQIRVLLRSQIKINDLANKRLA